MSQAPLRRPDGRSRRQLRKPGEHATAVARGRRPARPVGERRDRPPAVVAGADDARHPREVEPGPGHPGPLLLGTAGGPDVRCGGGHPFRSDAVALRHEVRRDRDLDEQRGRGLVGVDLARHPAQLAHAEAARAQRGGGVVPQKATSCSTWRSDPQRGDGAVPSTVSTPRSTVTSSGGSSARAPSGRSPRSASPTWRGSSTVSASTRTSNPRASSRETGFAGSAPPRLRPTGGPAASVSSTRRSSGSTSASSSGRADDAATPAAGRPRPPGKRETTSRTAGTSARSRMPRHAARLLGEITAGVPHERPGAQGRQRGVETPRGAGWDRAACHLVDRHRHVVGGRHDERLHDVQGDRVEVVARPVHRRADAGARGQHGQVRGGGTARSGRSRSSRPACRRPGHAASRPGGCASGSRLVAARTAMRKRRRQWPSPFPKTARPGVAGAAGRRAPGHGADLRGPGHAVALRGAGVPAGRGPLRPPVTEVNR